MKVCLIIAFYYGNRDSCSYQETLNYENIQRKALEKYKNSLSKIIFVRSVDYNIKNPYVENSNSSITYFYRENKDLSFGAWIDTIKSFREYDYYILCEDDYVFVKDNFDSELVSKYQNSFNSEGYLTNYQGNGMSTIGIISKKEVEKLEYFKNYKHISHCAEDTVKHSAMRGFMNQFTQHSFIDKYPVFPYWGNDKKIYIYTADKEKRTFQEIKEQTLLTCIQFLDDQCELDCKKNFVFMF